jgi:hypothetical protein
VTPAVQYFASLRGSGRRLGCGSACRGSRASRAASCCSRASLVFQFAGVSVMECFASLRGVGSECDGVFRISARGRE